MTVIQADAGPPATAYVLASTGTAAVGRHGAPYDSDIAPVAALLADRARAAMLMSLLDGLPRARAN